MRRRGWVRIVESFISLLIILFALLFFVSNQISKTAREEKIDAILATILEEVEKNYTLREAIISGNNEIINESIRNFLSRQYEFSFCVEEAAKTCFPEEIRQLKKQVYSGSILISYEIQDTINSKKFVLFLWER